MRAVIVLFVGLVFSQVVLAAPATVEAVEFPAWIEHMGVKNPLQSGQTLAAGDRITTGPGARVYLQMPEGSRVKLGENATFVVDQLNAEDGKQGVFRAALNLVKGAFRFTTDAVAKTNRRNVDIRVSTVTAGIRGTDLWGKAADDKDLVCLLEGKIAVHADGQPEQSMDQPLTFYVAPKGAAPLPVASVDVAQLKQWAAQTDLVATKGESRAHGAWRIVLAQVPQQTEALAWYDRLRAAGYPVRIRTYGVGKHRHYRVVLMGFVSRDDAQSVAQTLHDAFATPLSSVESGRVERS